MALSTKRPSNKSSAAHVKLMQDVTERKEEKKRLNVIVPKSKYQQMKAVAAKQDRNMSDITLELWDEYMSK